MVATPGTWLVDWNLPLDNPPPGRVRIGPGLIGLAFNVIDAAGGDRTAVFAALAVGDLLTIQNRNNPTYWTTQRVDGFAGYPTWWLLDPVVSLGGAGAAGYIQDDPVAVRFTADLPAVPPPPTWITVPDVRAAIGLDPADATDDAWLELVTGAANAFAFRRRSSSGYIDDPAVVPSMDVHTGTVLYAVSLYRERGTLDGTASFSELGTWVPTGGAFGQIKRLLAVDRPGFG